MCLCRHSQNMLNRKSHECRTRPGYSIGQQQQGVGVDEDYPPDGWCQLYGSLPKNTKAIPDRELEKQGTSRRKFAVVICSDFTFGQSIGMTHRIISRADARAAGLTRYFTGELAVTGMSPSGMSEAVDALSAVADGGGWHGSYIRQSIVRVSPIMIESGTRVIEAMLRRHASETARRARQTANVNAVVKSANSVLTTTMTLGNFAAGLRPLQSWNRRARRLTGRCSGGSRIPRKLLS